MSKRILVALLAGLVACPSSELPEFHQCMLDAELSATEGPPGTEIVATGGEYSVDYDTTVLVDAVPAPVLDVVRSNCAFCDGCRDALEEPCNACEECDDCSISCADCVQTVRFVVPDLAPGAVDVVLTNRFGTSGPIPFTVTAPAPAP